MNLVTAQNLVKIFKQGEIEVHALRGIDLIVKKGEFSALVGPSGSGKTTLLNCIGALDKFNSGKIEVASQDLSILNKNQLSDFRLHKIGFVFQSYNLLPVLTAFENIEYVLLLQGLPKKIRAKRTIQILGEMGLEDLRDRFPRQMSGGQQQRVAVARALVSEPQVVLADEPTANLDSQNTDTLLDLMEKMCNTTKTTFLFSTHDERVVRRAKRVIKLHDGKIVSSVKS